MAPHARQVARTLQCPPVLLGLLLWMLFVTFSSSPSIIPSPSSSFQFFLSFFHLNLPSTHFRFSFALSPLVKCSILITLKLQRYQLSPSAFYRYRKHSAVSEKNSAYWSSVVVQCTEKIDDDLAEIEELCHFFLFHCHSLFLLCVGSEIKYVICRTSALDRLSEKCCQCC